MIKQEWINNLWSAAAEDYHCEDCLEIHVLSGKKGESIIIGFPDGNTGLRKWGVVDCYASDSDDESTNVTLNFLKLKKIKELEFLCITHPHDDHYRGMSQVVNYMERIAHFWQFDAHGKILGDIITAMKETVGPNSRTKDANDLDTTLRTIKQRNIKKRYLASNTHLYPLPYGAVLPRSVA